MPTSARQFVLAGAAVLAVAGVSAYLWPVDRARDDQPAAAAGDDWAVYAGAHFSPEPLLADLLPPEATAVPVPDFPGAFAIWGAVGRAADGRVWFSAAAHSGDVQSGHLFDYDPATGAVTGRGDVLSELRRAGLLRPGERQPKIHTKILQGADGYLYFASTDDPADGQTTAAPPRWGARLWRHKPGVAGWEHLLAVPDGLLALAGDGTRLYGLSYPDHGLLQYDTRTRAVRRVTVGSVEGHVSRHLLCDRRGHAYVPRLRMVRADHAEHTLVEFDPALREVAEFPLPHYQHRAAVDSHGVVAYQPLADGSLAFTTHAGRLFRVRVPAGAGPARLDDLGWFHPGGPSYATGLFAFSGERWLVGAADVGGRWEWVCHDLAAARSTAQPLPLPAQAGRAVEYPFLYGCTTRDDAGHFYLVGAYRREDGRPTPTVVRLRAHD